MDMTKFEDIEDPGFVAVTGELRRWIKNIMESSYRPIRDEETQGAPESRVLAMTQDGSHFHGPTVRAANLVQIRVHTLQGKVLASMADRSHILSNPRGDRGKGF
jgi:hypothetical protein